MGNFRFISMKPVLGRGQISMSLHLLHSCSLGSLKQESLHQKYGTGITVSGLIKWQVHRLKSIYALKGSAWTTVAVKIFDNFSLTRGSWCSWYVEKNLWPIKGWESLLKMEFTITAESSSQVGHRYTAVIKCLRRAPAQAARVSWNLVLLPCSSLALVWGKGQGLLFVFHLCRGVFIL